MKMNDLLQIFNKSIMTDATSGAGKVHPPRAHLSTIVCLSPYFFCQLCCLSIFDLRLLITPLVSSNCSYIFISLI